MEIFLHLFTFVNLWLNLQKQSFIGLFALSDSICSMDSNFLIFDGVPLFKVNDIIGVEAGVKFDITMTSFVVMMNIDDFNGDNLSEFAEIFLDIFLIYVGL